MGILSRSADKIQQEASAMHDNGSATLRAPEVMGNELAAVRDLLFGEQVRAQGQEFARLEEKILDQVGALRGETHMQIEALERKLDEKLTALGAQLETQEQQQATGEKQTQKKLAAIAASLEGDLADVRDKAATGERKLRDQIFTQSAQLSSTITQRYGDLMAVLERRFAELDGKKLDREMLAKIVCEAAGVLMPTEQQPSGDDG